MPTPRQPQIITANLLIEGDVVYLTADDQWCKTMADAEVITDEAHGQLRLLFAHTQPDEIVGAYMTDVALAENGPTPNHFREVFRAKGPSNYNHGKQEVAHV